MIRIIAEEPKNQTIIAVIETGTENDFYHRCKYYQQASKGKANQTDAENKV